MASDKYLNLSDAVGVHVLHRDIDGNEMYLVCIVAHSRSLDFAVGSRDDAHLWRRCVQSIISVNNL